MAFCPSAPYYKYVRYRFLFTSILLMPLLLASACDRGVHPMQTGKMAPDFTVSDGSATVHLANYRGRVVLLNFWASWCPPCVAELPSLLQLHHDHPELVILAISADEDADAYKRFLARRHVDLITVRDPNGNVANLYKTEMWPETYVIDRQGIIRRKFVGSQDWSSLEILAYLKSL
jgi:cytochrome c biogenesis protein CcmG, thiol:disulfide interchange protein DsbE